MPAPQVVAYIEGAAEIPGRVDPSQAKEVGLFCMLGTMGEREIKQDGVVKSLIYGVVVAFQTLNILPV